MKKKYKIILITCAMTCTIAGLFWKLRSQGKDKGIMIRPEEDCPVGSIISYCQKDEAWSDDKLGKSVYRMGGSGCLISCIAAGLSSECQNLGIGKIITAGELNQLFGQHGVYNQQGDIVWGRIEDAMPEVEVFVASSVDSNEIEELLKEGHYPIIKVKVEGTKTAHWVMLVGSEDGEYLCMDPLEKDGKLIPLSRHGGVVYRMRCVYWAE